MVACGVLVRSSCPRSAPLLALALVSAFGTAVVIGRPANPVVAAGAQPLRVCLLGDRRGNDTTLLLVRTSMYGRIMYYRITAIRAN